MEQNDENPSSQTQSEHELVVRIEVSKKNRNISTKISKEKSERLKSAWVAVKECSMTLYAAAKKYDVPVSTLWDWCQRNDIIDQLPVVGRPCFLGTALEDKLKEWIFEAAQTGFPINSAQLMFEAKRYNERHSIVDGWEPGPKWFRGFKRRNKDISLRIPQYMSPKKFSLTENQIREWFTKVSEYLESTCQDVLDDPNRIFNVDETSFCVNPKLGKVLVKRGTKNVYNLTMDNEKDCYTALIGGNAAGLSTPVLLIFAGKRLPNQLNTYLPNGWHANVSDSGWMNCDIFFDYVTKSFYPWLQKNKIPTPVVLFVDGHVSHRSLDLSKFCLENGIILVSLIPNSTHLLQPMDVVVFGPTKRKWSAVIKDYRRANQAMERMPKPIFVALLDECLKECIKTDTLKSSFSKTALYPFGANNFDYSQLPSNVNDSTSYNRPKQYTQMTFIADLEKLINHNFPGKIDEFKNAAGVWTGDLESYNLFVLWEAAGNNRLVDSMEETFELIDVDYSVDLVGDGVHADAEDSDSDRFPMLNESTALSSPNSSCLLSNQTNRDDEVDDGSECDANITSEIRQIIAETQSHSWFDEDNVLFNQENILPNIQIQQTMQQTHRKSTNPIISSPDYIQAMTEVQKKKAAVEIEKKNRRAVRLEKARAKLEKMQENISKLQSQVSKDKN